MAETNPNGANQYQLDPRQKLCWESYIDPKSETFGNAYQSAMKAGYEEGYAAQITTVEWFLEKVRRMNLLSKAEKVLEECLDMNTYGEKGTDAQLVKIKQDTAKFVAETQGKAEGYSKRTEMTGEGGGPITVVAPQAVIDSFKLNGTDDKTRGSDQGQEPV
jgi:hypothetical protein